MASPKLVMEEAPESYKNVTDVVNTCKSKAKGVIGCVNSVLLWYSYHPSSAFVGLDGSIYYACSGLGSINVFYWATNN